MKKNQDTNDIDLMYSEDIESNQMETSTNENNSQENIPTDKESLEFNDISNKKEASKNTSKDMNFEAYVGNANKKESKHSNKFVSKTFYILLAVLMALVIIILVFIGYRPVKYNLNVGSIAVNDIYAQRNVIDNYETEHLAIIAKNSVEPIFIRSESISNQCIENVENYFNIIYQSKAMMLDDYGTPIEDTAPVVELFIENMKTLLNIDMTEEEAIYLLSLPNTTINYIQDKTTSIAEIILMNAIDESTIPMLIDNQILSLVGENSSYSVYNPVISNCLNQLLVSNSVFDMEATNQAAQNAYNIAIDNPIEIEKGTRIVSSGDVISEHTYQILSDLELISGNSYDYILIIRVVLYVALIMAVALIYLNGISFTYKNNHRMYVSLCVVFLIPIFVSVYASDISPLACFVLFFTYIAATYLSASRSIILSLICMLFLMPVYGFDTELIIVSFIGISTCALLAGRKSTKQNTASLIILTILSVCVTSAIFNFLNGATQNEYIDSLTWTLFSTSISLVTAIGLIPIFELLSNAVSPIKLINLSQPAHPLLKQIFIEAPGTSQHSMMVANLSDAAAEAVGADPLLCKVASYYHDVGKLTNPLYFTENQTDYNPHSVLTPFESTSIITAHIEDGVRLAKKHRLPQNIIDIIYEHHGTTYPKYFYIKACENARNSGEPEPSIKDFCYKGRIPQSKESAIVMIADTSEAAIKSLNTTDLNKVEALIRTLIKQKIEQDQLVNSGLSFEDLEKIIKAFMNVYTGQYHERIKYPDEK